ncbi:MAG: hypothetical protein AAF509_03140 [Pseudomonadota bacterium]
MHGDEMTPLKSGGPEAGAGAVRTRALWASLGSYLQSDGVMIAKRDGQLSIASHKGGIILETSGPVNIGMLKAALQHEAVVRPTVLKGEKASLWPAQRALWSLARWIDGTETARFLQITAGSAAFQIAARKGAFCEVSGAEPAAIVAAFEQAGAEGAAVMLAYADLPDPWPAMTHQPIDLLCKVEKDAGTLTIRAANTPISVPAPVNLEEAMDFARLAGPLSTWGNGDPFEIIYLPEGSRQETIARSDGPGHIELSLRRAPIAAE